MIVIIDDDPPVGFWDQSRSALLPTLSYQRLVSLPIWRSPVYMDGGAENANGTVTLDNGDGLLSDQWEMPPLRRTLRIYDDADTEIITGVITDVTIGAEIALTVEA